VSAVFQKGVESDNGGLTFKLIFQEQLSQIIRLFFADDDFLFKAVTRLPKPVKDGYTAHDNFPFGRTKPATLASDQNTCCGGDGVRHFFNRKNTKTNYRSLEIITA